DEFRVTLCECSKHNDQIGRCKYFLAVSRSVIVVLKCPSYLGGPVARQITRCNCPKDILARSVCSILLGSSKITRCGLYLIRGDIRWFLLRCFPSVHSLDCPEDALLRTFPRDINFNLALQFGSCRG